MCGKRLEKDKLKEKNKSQICIIHIIVKLAVITTTAYVQFRPCCFMLAAGGK